jgi:4-amino-4-deoxy-L-arabinose transferase-like glycosyltransferase
VSGRRYRVLLLAIVALYLAQALYFARTLVPVSDGIQYLMIGARVVRGELGVFDDRLPGNRLPIPFYVLGATQLGGPSLARPRLLNVAFGVCTLLLVIGLARGLAGQRAGWLAGLFLATQGVVIAYYSYEGYPAFAALSLTATMFLLFARDSVGFRLLGAAATGLLMLVRSNLWPAVPFLLAWALWRARSLRERAAIAALAVVPPLLYLISEPTHLKILAYVPVVRRVVAPLGYNAALVLDVQERLPLRAQLWALAIIARRYEFWVLAAALLGVLALWRWRVRGWPASIDRRAVVLTAFFGYLLVANFAMFSWNFKWVGLYFASFAPLLPVLLGVGYDGLLRESRPGSRRRRALLAVLAVLFVGPMYWVRNPILPTGAVRASDPYAAVHEAAAELRAAVPDRGKVFFYGLNTAYYMSGLPQTYLQMLYNPDAVARPNADERMLRRFGMVPPEDVERWLTSDADWAVIDMRFFDLRRADPVAGGAEPLIATLLARYFDEVARVERPPFQMYAVYRRKASGATASAGEATSAPADRTTGTGPPR